VPSPDINTEDFSAAVDFLGLQPSVDRERIGIIGICGFGGMGLSAAAVDKCIKAVVTTSMYDMLRVMANGYYDSLTKEQRTQMLEEMSRQRWADAERGRRLLARGFCPRRWTAPPIPSLGCTSTTTAPLVASTHALRTRTAPGLPPPRCRS
jgi:hypothetical protein